MLSQNIDNNNSTTERKTSLGAMLLLNSAGVHDTKVRHNKRDFQSFILFIKIIKYCLFHRSRVENMLENAVSPNFPFQN